MPDLTPLAVRDANIGSYNPSLQKSAAGQKRKVDYADSSGQSAPQGYTGYDDWYCAATWPKNWNANQVRNKIRQYVNSGEVTVAELEREFGVSSTSYYRFMHQSGSSRGVESDTYSAAYEFFSEREEAGLKMPRSKKARSGNNAREQDTKNPAKKASDKDDLDVSGIHLDGEENDTVPIFDTPDDLRIKINAHQRRPVTTQAGLMRELKARVHTEDTSKGFSTTSLKTYLQQHGAAHGTKNKINYAAYVYFEKLRIKQGKPKSEKRKDMEQVWGFVGQECEWDMSERCLMSTDDMHFVSQFGEVQMVKGRNNFPKDTGDDGPERKWKCYTARA